MSAVRKPRVRQAKHVFSIKVMELQVVKDKSGAVIDPRHVILTEYVDVKCKIEVNGPIQGSSHWAKNAWRTAYFNLYGYDQYPPVPTWLIKLLEDAGYSKRMAFE